MVKGCLKKLGKGNFEIVTMKEHLLEENFAKTAIFHIRRLTNLKENGVFAAEAVGIIESLIDFGFGSRAGKYQRFQMDVKK